MYTSDQQKAIAKSLDYVYVRHPKIGLGRMEVAGLAMHLMRFVDPENKKQNFD